MERGAGGASVASLTSFWLTRRFLSCFLQIDTTQVQTAEDELKKVNISEKIELVESTLDDIPTAVANLSTDATKGE